MRTARKWVLVLGMLGQTLYGVSCSTDFRDGVVAGAIDYVTATTTEALITILPFEDPFVRE